MVTRTLADRCWIRRMSVVVSLVVVLSVVLAAWVWLRQHPNAPPQLSGALPIIGHSHQFLGDLKHLWNFVQEIQIASLAKGGVIGVRVFTHTFYVVTDPDDALTVANSCLSKPYIYDFAKEQMKNGLITSEASIWKAHRKLLNPAFNQQVLNTYVNEMNVQARSLVSQLALKAEKGPVDIRKFFVNYMLSTVTRTSLRLNTQDQTIILTDYAKAIDNLFALYCERFTKVWLHLPSLFDWSAMKRKQTILLKKVKEIMDPIISKRRSELKTNMYDNSTADKFKPILDHMLYLAEEQNAFTEDDIREHLDTLVAASYDTMTTTLTFMLLVIGSHRDLQNRIYNEIQEVLEHKDDITKEDLPKLVYLDAVVKEIMRLYPSAPIIGRKIDKDLTLSTYLLNYYV